MTGKREVDSGKQENQCGGAPLRLAVAGLSFTAVTVADKDVGAELQGGIHACHSRKAQACRYARGWE